MTGSHLLVIPIVLPLVTAALSLLLGDRRRLRSGINIASVTVGLVVAAYLLVQLDRAPGSTALGGYLASNWEAPFGIALVADRLTAMMLVTVGVVGLAAAIYAEASWARVGVYFYPLFQVQLMGLNGAFLTGDLFNLFVFFEVMLAASYGLQLHGSGLARVRAGVHYIAVNLLASALFLVGLAVLYGVVGTLSMADFAAKVADVPSGDRGLLHAGTAILAMAFLIKAAVWPLGGWLGPTYASASAPAAAVFALMTKVGVYALLRLSTLVFSGEGPSARFGESALLTVGLATIAFGAIGVLSSVSVSKIAGYSIVVSSGTLLAALGLGRVEVLGAALFYLVSATFAMSALYLLVDLLERVGADGRVRPPDVDTEEPDEDTNLDDDALPLVGRTLPVSIAALGVAFMTCAILVIGLPPLSGFVAKLGLLAAALDGPGSATAPSWWYVGLVLGAGFVATLSFTRAGIRHFWARERLLETRLRLPELAALIALIGCGVALTVFAEPAIRYTRDAAAGAYDREAYIGAVLSMRPRPGPTRPVIDPGAAAPAVQDQAAP